MFDVVRQLNWPVVCGLAVAVASLVYTLLRVLLHRPARTHKM